MPPALVPNSLLSPCNAAYSPLPWAMARLTWYGGVPMLLFSIACFYYCAMLTVGTAAPTPALRLLAEALYMLRNLAAVSA